MRATSLSGHPRPQHPPGWVHPGSQQVSPPRWELPHTGCEAQPEAGGQGLARPLPHTLPKPGGRGQARSRAERELVRSDTASVPRPGQWRLASSGLSTGGLQAGQAGPLPAPPGCSLPLSGTRDAASTPDGPGGALQGLPVSPRPWVLRAGAPAPSRAAPRSVPRPQSPGRPPPAACGVCTPSPPPVASVRGPPASVWLLSRCRRVCVSVSLCMWLAEVPWRACRHGAGRGASERRPEARPANARPPLPGHWCRCIEEQPGGLLALEPMPTFGKGLDLRRAAEEAFEVKDVLNPTLDSETLKQTLYRQAKNQVGTEQSPPPPAPPGQVAGGGRASSRGGHPGPGARQDRCPGAHCIG